MRSTWQLLTRNHRWNPNLNKIDNWIWNPKSTIEFEILNSIWRRRFNTGTLIPLAYWIACYTDLDLEFYSKYIQCLIVCPANRLENYIGLVRDNLGLEILPTKSYKSFIFSLTKLDKNDPERKFLCEMSLDESQPGKPQYSGIFDYRKQSLKRL